MRARLILIVLAFVLLSSALLLDARATARRDPPWISADTRASLRAVFFSRTGVGGSYVIDHGRPQWKAEYDESLDDLTLGKRIRLGQNAWSTLDCTCPLTFGDKKEVKPNQYYLALERDKKGAWFLVLLDAADLRKKRIDPFQSATTSGGTAIALQHAESQDHAAVLTVELIADQDDEFEQLLRIRFGKHVLSTSVKAKV